MKRAIAALHAVKAYILLDRDLLGKYELPFEKSMATRRIASKMAYQEKLRDLERREEI